MRFFAFLLHFQIFSAIRVNSAEEWDRVTVSEWLNKLTMTPEARAIMRGALINILTAEAYEASFVDFACCFLKLRICRLLCCTGCGKLLAISAADIFVRC